MNHAWQTPHGEEQLRAPLVFVFVTLSAKLSAKPPVAVPVAAAKALVKFANDSKKLQIKAAFVEGRLLAAAEVESMSKIRGKHELHGAMVGSLKSPFYRLHGTLHAGISKLVRTLHALHGKRSEAQHA